MNFKLNAVNYILLKLFLLPATLYQKAGVNTQQLKLLLSCKLIMDDRRPNAMQQTRAKQKEDGPITNATIGTMLMALLMGLVFIMGFLVTNDAATAFTIFFSLFILMLALTLITDFSHVLMDVRDNLIILPHPVGESTFMFARILHICIHLFKIMIPMAIPAMITVGIKYGLVALALFVSAVLLSALFSVFVVNGMYLLIMRITTPERFKTIISYVQIAFAILVYGSYQLVPRLVNKTILEDSTIGDHATLLLLPPYWFAGFMQQAVSLKASPVMWSAAVLACLMPIASLGVVIKILAPMYTRQLAGLASGSSGTSTKKNVQHIKPASRYSSLLASLVTSRGIERTSFLFTWKMMLRNRDFKLKAYPAIGYMAVLIIMMFVRRDSDITLSESLSITGENSSPFSFLMLLYFSGLVGLIAIGLINFTEHFKASWVFYASPINQPGLLVTGAFRAAVAQLQLPFYLLSIAWLTSINGLAALPHICAALTNLGLMGILMVYFSQLHIPWSKAPNEDSQSGNALKGLMLILLLGGVVTVHYFAFNHTIAVLLIFLASAITLKLLLSSVARAGWGRVV
jgi:hypothetical protein